MTLLVKASRNYYSLELFTFHRIPMKIPFQVVFMRVSVGIAGADEVLRVIHAGVCLHPTV